MEIEHVPYARIRKKIETVSFLRHVATRFPPSIHGALQRGGAISTLIALLTFWVSGDDNPQVRHRITSIGNESDGVSFSKSGGAQNKGSITHRLDGKSFSSRWYGISATPCSSSSEIKTFTERTRNVASKGKNWIQPAIIAFTRQRRHPAGVKFSFLDAEHGAGILDRVADASIDVSDEIPWYGSEFSISLATNRTKDENVSNQVYLNFRYDKVSYAGT